MKEIPGTTKEEIEAKSRASEGPQLIQEEDSSIDRNQLNIFVPRFCWWWQEGSCWAEALSRVSVLALSSLSFFHLRAKWTKWDGWKVSIVLNVSPSWAPRAPSVLPRPSPCTQHCSASNIYPLFTLFWMSSFWLLSFPPTTIYSWILTFLPPFFLIRPYKCLVYYRLPIMRNFCVTIFFIICMQNGCILFEGWNPEGRI